MDDQDPLKPSEVDEHVPLFDRFAGRISLIVSRAPFFFGVVVFIALWLAQGIVEMAINGPQAFVGTTYQLEVNTSTTILTVLLVSLFQNSQTRYEAATNKKLNAMTDAQADLMEWMASHADTEEDRVSLHRHAHELRQAVGLEHREST